MGKIRTRILGLEEIEQKQKEKKKKRAQEKKQTKHKIRAPGLKGGERMVEVEVKEEDLAKMKKAEGIIESTQIPEKKTTETKEKKQKKIKIHHRGKNYQNAKKQLDTILKRSGQDGKFSLAEAIAALKKVHFASFDESVELHLNVDKVGLKGEVELPHPTGKSVKVAVVDEKVLDQIEKGKIDFDVLVAHPSFMPKLVKFAKILGPKGLMPNPKAGTISDHPEEVVKKFQKGVLRWKTEAKFPLIHQMIGKISMEEKKLIENATSFIKSVGLAHIKSAFIKTTMSPAVKVELTSEIK